MNDTAETLAKLVKRLTKETSVRTEADRVRQAFAAELLAVVSELEAMQRAAEMRAHLTEQDPDLLFADGFDLALLGCVQRFNQTVVLYDRQKCIQVLMNRDGMSSEEAEEFFEFNVVGAFVGDYTPAFATILTGPQE